MGGMIIVRWVVLGFVLKMSGLATFRTSSGRHRDQPLQEVSCKTKPGSLVR